MQTQSAHREALPTPSRRGFMAGVVALAGAWLAAAAYPVFKYLSPQAEPDPFAEGGKVRVEKVSPAEVAKPGQGKNGGYGSRGLIVLRDENDRLRAFDAKCSHAGCNVSFAGTKLYCHCHGGTYDFNGKNVAGPPPKPLRELAISEAEGALFVSSMTPPRADRG